MALSGCTDYLFPPQPLENIQSKQLNENGYQNDLSEIARDPGNNFSLEA